MGSPEELGSFETDLKRSRPENMFNSGGLDVDNAEQSGDNYTRCVVKSMN